MKTISLKTGFVIAALFISFSGICGGHGNPESIRHEIQSKLNVKAGKSEKIEVVFTTGKDGKVNLVIARTGDKTLQKAIEDNFMKLQLENLIPENCYSIQLNFKLL